MNNFALIIIALAIGLAFQLLFTGWQAKRFYARLKEIDKDGLTSIGMEGGIWNGRIYAVLVVDEENNILHAEKMSGWTIFSQLKPVPELEGLSVDEILDELNSFPIKKKLIKAFRNAAVEITKREGEPSSTIEKHEIKGVRIKSENKTSGNSQG